jgi:hypothetical protein
MTGRKRRSSTPREYVKIRLRRGDSSGAIRVQINYLVAQPPSFFEPRQWRRWRGLSGQKPLTAKEIHRIQSALGRKVRAERKERRLEMRLLTSSAAAMAEARGEPGTTGDAQRAHDAGMLYRVTEDEAYKEIFEQEGSP